MKFKTMNSVVLLVILLHWDSAWGLCKLDPKKPTSAECKDIDDARDIETYNLRSLKAATSSTSLSSKDYFKNLSSLDKLDLSGGKLEKIESGSFVTFPNLQILNLDDNEISVVEKGAFDGLKQLRVLSLSNNSVQELPPALTSLKKLKSLDLSANPLNCSCQTLKVRDQLRSNGVKISKKALCATPKNLTRTSFAKVDRECDEGEIEQVAKKQQPKKQDSKKHDFEQEDLEMQADQPQTEVEAETAIGGESKVNQTEDSNKNELESEEKKEDETAATTTVLSVTTSESTNLSQETILDETPSPVTTEVSSSENVEGTTEIVTESPSSSTTTSTETPKTSEAEPTSSTTSTESPTNPEVDPPKEIEKPQVPPVIYEGSGGDEGEGEDGSGDDFSDLISTPPKIDYKDTPNAIDTEDRRNASDSEVTSSTTTESSLFSWSLSSLLNQMNPFATSDTTTETPTTTTTTTTAVAGKSVAEEAKEEGFIPVKPVTSTRKLESSADAAADPDEGVKSTATRTAEVDDSVNTAPSRESKNSMSPYMMLVTFLVILAVLVGYMAYRGDFCRKNRKRGDVERGTELKDMQKTLLDHGANNPAKAPPVANGNTMENVPLMNSGSNALPDEPREKQRSYEVNGSSKLNGSTTTTTTTQDYSDPVKPPRRSTNSGEIEAPLNGLHPPMEDIDGPTRTSWINGSNEVMNREEPEEDFNSSSPAQKVKITLQEIPDSVLKKPIMITRLQDGENIVKAP